MGKQKARKPSGGGTQRSTATTRTPPANSKRARSPKHLDEDDNPRKKLHLADETDLSASLPLQNSQNPSTRPPPQTNPPPPQPPPAQTQTPSSSPIDLTPLLQKFTAAHHVTPISVISSASIEKKVTRALELLLSAYPTPAGERPRVVLLYAKATAASKLITVVEIVKREVALKEGKWYQYTIVNSSLEERKDGVADGKGKGNGSRNGTGVNVAAEAAARKGKGKDKGKDQGKAGGDVSMGGIGSDDGEVGDGEEEEEEEEEESFEVMKTPFERAIEGTPKVRAVPVMAVVLSRVRIDSLRGVHGEQSNGLPAS